MYRTRFEGILSNPNRKKTLSGCATVNDLLRFIWSILRFEMPAHPFSVHRHWLEVCGAAVILCCWKRRLDIGRPTMSTIRRILKRYPVSDLPGMHCKRTARMIGAGLSIPEERELARRLRLLRRHAQKYLAIRTDRTGRKPHDFFAIVGQTQTPYHVSAALDRRIVRSLATIRSKYGASHHAHRAECACGRPNPRIMRTPLLRLECGASHKGRGPP